MSRLYMVATPIGNLEDITMRALKVLGEVDVIACEDTRHTGLLLSHYGIHKRTIACHAHNEEQSAKGIMELLSAGSDVAYCSDAGTPGISDPGARLAEAVRSAGFEVVPIPGPSAVVTLLSAAGNVGRTFTFEGFLSPKKGRREKRLRELIARGETFIIYESPFRVLKTLADIAAIDERISIVCGRELTKQFEEIITGSVKEVMDALQAKPSIKGEFAIAVRGGRTDADDQEDRESEAPDQGP